MRLRTWTPFVVMLMILISIAHADAAPSIWRAVLTVDYIDAGVSGIELGDQFMATFEVDPSLFNKPYGVQDGKFVAFDLTIGTVNWNESQPHRMPQFLLSPTGIAGVSVRYTDTMPAHPDLYLFLPKSPATWNVKDEPDSEGKPIFGGDFGGTYAVWLCYTYDLDCDGDVDIVDVMQVASCWNSSTGHPNFEPTYDFDNDGDIDILDVMKVAVEWGWTP